MPSNSNALYSQQYATAVELAAQQTMPRIASTFMPESITGSGATVVNLIDVGEAEERTELYTPIIPSDVDHRRPWVYPRHFDKAVLFDNIEAMQTNANPTSTYVQGIVNAINRKCDDEAILRFFADRQISTGTNAATGTTTDSFSSSRQISVDIGGNASSLNVEKLQAILEAMRGVEVGVEEDEIINIAITPKQEHQLMNEIEVISSDFTVKRIMDAGTMIGSGYMRFNWILSNRLLLDGNGYTRIPVWTKRGMCFGTWNGGVMNGTKVSQREDLRGQPWQCYGQGDFGAVRRDEKRVWEIKAA